MWSSPSRARESLTEFPETPKPPAGSRVAKLGRSATILTLERKKNYRFPIWVASKCQQSQASELRGQWALEQVYVAWSGGETTLTSWLPHTPPQRLAVCMCETVSLTVEQVVQASFLLPNDVNVQPFPAFGGTESNLGPIPNFIECERI